MIGIAEEDQSQNGDRILGRLELGVGTKFVGGIPEAFFEISVTHPEVWAGRQLTPDELIALQTPGAKLSDEYWMDISQFLQHCTERRHKEVKEWNLQEMKEKLHPVLEFFKGLFPPTPTQGTPVLSTKSASTTPLNARTVLPPAKKV